MCSFSLRSFAISIQNPISVYDFVLQLEQEGSIKFLYSIIIYFKKWVPHACMITYFIYNTEWNTLMLKPARKHKLVVWGWKLIKYKELQILAYTESREKTGQQIHNLILPFLYFFHMLLKVFEIFIKKISKKNAKESRQKKEFILSKNVCLFKRDVIFGKFSVSKLIL